MSDPVDVWTHTTERWRKVQVPMRGNRMLSRPGVNDPAKENGIANVDMVAI
jgi:hypothetical protein